MTEPALQERAVLELLRENYARTGGTFIMYPGGDLVPAFLGSYKPDAIVKGAGEGGVVIEVRSSKSQRQSERLQDIAGMFIGHPEWTLRVVSLDELAAEGEFGSVDDAMIVNAIGEFYLAEHSGAPHAALLLGWSIVESIATPLITSRTTVQRPLQALSLVSALEQYGLLDGALAAKLRLAAKARNEIAHGRFGADVTEHLGVVRSSISALRSEYPV